MKKLPTLFKNVGRLMLAVVLIKCFGQNIAEYYAFRVPTYGICVSMVIVLEAIGVILRGKTSYFFEEE